MSTNGQGPTFSDPRIEQHVGWSQTEPSESNKIPYEGGWLFMKSKRKDWPEDLAEDLFFLFHELFVQGGNHDEEEVCLCQDVVSCELKKRAVENRECRWYSNGLCMMATLNARGGEPLKYQAIAQFHGISRQRADQIDQAMIKTLKQVVLTDPVIKEYLEGIATGTRDLPSVGGLVSLMESV